MRLNQYIAACGVCSRREADRLVQAGQVLVDGQPAEAERANFGLTAVFVPQGTQEIRFRYMPVGFLPAAAVSALTALLLIGEMIRRRMKTTR